MKDIGVMVAIVGTGVALATVIVIGQGQLRSDMRERFSNVETEIASVRDDLADVRDDLADVRDRVSRIEGLLSRPGMDYLNPPAIADTETPSENDG